MSQHEKIQKLIAENAQLKLYFVSLIRLLTKNGSISKQELLAMVAAVDAEDGRADGQFTGAGVYPSDSA
jgi:hypothetical protein